MSVLACPTVVRPSHLALRRLVEAGNVRAWAVQRGHGGDFGEATMLRSAGSSYEGRARRGRLGQRGHGQGVSVHLVASGRGRALGPLEVIDSSTCRFGDSDSHGSSSLSIILYGPSHNRIYRLEWVLLLTRSVFFSLALGSPRGGGVSCFTFSCVARGVCTPGP